jgi:DNA sulfur modification protein DndE
MESPIETIRLSPTAKDRLLKLKRVTKIDRWNVLCRWALCRSLSVATIPSESLIDTQTTADNTLEISWQTLGGEIGDLLLIALKQRCHQDGLGTDRQTLALQLNLHIHRGIGYLVGDLNVKTIAEFLVANNTSICP